MDETRIEKVAKAAAKEAIAELKEEERKSRKVKIFRNTEALMKNYDRMVKSVQEGVSNLSDLTEDPIEGLEDDSNMFIDSIVRSKLRSLIMLAHVDKCLKLLEDEEYERNTHERYLAFKFYYIDHMSHESISEVLNCTDRTSRRWVNELTRNLSVYIFGVDALML